MRILGIETSCDETAAAVVEDGPKVVSECLASQEDLHGPYGGVVPELACRRHVTLIDRVVQTVLDRSRLKLSQLDAVAVTRGPGLIGALLVGLGFAKSLAYASGLPLIGINHLEGHIQAIRLEGREIVYPAVALVVSGGHTHLFQVLGPGDYRLIGRTLDDAAGEALDKGAKLLGLGYPGGPAIDRLSRDADPAYISFPRSLLGPASLDFSFSGLKTSLLRYVETHGPQAQTHLPHIAASYQQAVMDVLTEKALRASRTCRVKTLIVGGGVAANSVLRGQLERAATQAGLELLMPRPRYCTDNASMIAAAAGPYLLSGRLDGIDLDPRAALPLHGAQALPH